MLNFKKIIGIAAIIAVIGMAFFSCEEEKPGLVPGVKMGPGVKGNAPDFTGNSVTTRAQAQNLWDELSYHSSMSGFGINGALNLAVAAGEFTEKETTLSYTFSGKFNDASSAAFDTALRLKGLTGDKKASVKGSVDITVSGNLTTNTYTIKNSDKSNLTVTIPALITDGSNKFGGVVYVEGSGSTSTTADITTDKTKGNGKGKGKAYATVTYFSDDLGYGGKLRFAYSSGSSEFYKATGSQEGSSWSDVEVYNNANELIATLYGEEYFSSFFDTFVPSGF